MSDLRDLDADRRLCENWSADKALVQEALEAVLDEIARLKRLVVYRYPDGDLFEVVCPLPKPTQFPDEDSAWTAVRKAATK